MPRKKGKLTLDQRALLPTARKNSHLEYLRVNRQEICLREINAAIRLFIIDEDPISAHLLASAATEILSALSGGKPGVGLNDMRALIKTAGVPVAQSDDLFQSLLHPYNFLKHGSSDFSAANDFSLDFIVMTIYNSVHSYKLIFNEMSAEMIGFYAIVQSWRTFWWQGTPGFEDMQKTASSLNFEGASYKEMYALGRDLLDKIRTTRRTP